MKGNQSSKKPQAKPMQTQAPLRGYQFVDPKKKYGDNPYKGKNINELSEAWKNTKGK